ncbi:MAG: hypothetical protein J0L93_06940 [Deltaproteobacteria bacterium]|nr:hypothetical protein [Deltaproteobacteria bacterium]
MKVKSAQIKDWLKSKSVTPSIMQMLRVVKDPSAEGSIWNDYRKTFKEASFIRSANFPQPAKKLLVLSLTDWIYQIKHECLLSTGLKMAGYAPTILISYGNFWAPKYFRAFGIKDFIYWEDFSMSSTEWIQSQKDSQAFLSGPLSIRTVKEWNYRGSWIGPKLISSISRKQHLGAPDLSTPESRDEISNLLPLSLANVGKAQKILTSNAPDLVIVNEANNFAMSPIIDFAVQNKTNVVQFIQPSRDDALIFKRLTPETRRLHAVSLSPQELERLSQKPWTSQDESELHEEINNRYGGRWFLQSRNQPGTKPKSKNEIFKQLNLNPTKKVATVFSHVLWDANLFYGVDLFEDYGDWFIQTVKAANNNCDINWIIKLHPANLFKRAQDKRSGELSEMILIRKYIGELKPHVKLVFPDTDISTKSLFEITDYGITVRGTVGIELPCFGKLVLTAGTGRYSGLGFTKDFESQEKYIEALLEIQNLEPMSEKQTLLAKRHAHTIFKLRPWLHTSFRSTFNYPKEGRHPLDHNIELEAKSISEIERNGDLRSWASWADNVDKVDYLNLANDP